MLNADICYNLSCDCIRNLDSCRFHKQSLPVMKLNNGFKFMKVSTLSADVILDISVLKINFKSNIKKN